MTKKDIEQREDIVLFVNEFYDKVLADAVLSPFFKNMNFENHLPRMVNFWAFVLLDEEGYKTDVTQLHMKMRIKKEHFDRWIELFNSTIDRLFAGSKADLAKQRAFLIGWTIESKIRKSL